MTDPLEPAPNGPMSDGDAVNRLSPPGGPTPQATFEHEIAWEALPAPAIPVVARTTPRRSGRSRWGMAIGVIALVLATTVGVALLITGQTSPSSVIGYVPADAVMYGEVRLDLPGDQRRAVGEFLSKFPGFADQAALDTKLDQVLDDLVSRATNQGETYTKDIKPWFDGQIGFSVGPLPPVSSLSGGDPAAAGSLRALALISVKDPVAAQSWFDAAIAKSGASATKETYGGATLTVIAKTGEITVAVAVVGGKVVVAGDIASVKAAIDTGGASGFASAPGPKAAIDASTADYVGFVYTALRPLMDWSNQLGAARAAAPSGAPGTVALGQAILNVVPDWGAYWLRIESDAVVMEAVAPKAQTPLGPTDNRSSTVLEHVPATAIVASESNDFGKTLKGYLDAYRADPAAKSTIDQLDQALGLVGGADAALGWAGDTAIVVNVSDGTPEGGLVVAPTDKAAADPLFTSLRSLVALGGAQAGITVRDETYNGTTITTVDLGDLTRLAGLAGTAGTSSGLALPVGHLEIAYAVTADVVVIGSGSGFVKHVLDTTKPTSLASDARYSTLAGRAGAGVGTVFVDISAVRGLIEKAVGTADPTALAKYEKDVKPFLVPFDAIVGSTSVNGGMTRSVIDITVK
ncbi:MAG: hypothetical protein QOE66_580 [Chloroflexota bacterium]|jgi:hypothetical protein|nr:hypothetical protein [Chloroflexota bacterium]